MSDTIFKHTKKAINIEKGLFVGRGVNMKDPTGDAEDVYVPWNTLNSHLMCFGTTRMGKTRMLIHSAKQIISKGDDLIMVDPKGAIDQEMYSWLVQYATAENRQQDIVYFSPFHKEMSAHINMLYGMGDEEITSAIIGAIDADEAFYLDIANEILMSVLPGLSFLQERLDPLVLQIMERIEYSKTLVERHYNRLNKWIMQSDFDERIHSIKNYIKEEYLELAENDDDVRRINRAYALVMQRYSSGNKTFPIRKFVTFADLAPYATQGNIKSLYEIVKAELEEARRDKTSEDIIRLGEQAVRELEKVSQRDSNYFSKVTSTYATTMTKLSTGDVGEVLCTSKINFIRDRFYLEDSGLIMFVQPFPMKYSGAANSIIKMLMSMVNSTMAHVGSSGQKNYRRIFVQVDEAGTIINKMSQELANKGGGLGVSLMLFSQSFKDYIQALGEEGAAILADNSNTKMFFKVNDDASAETVSRIIGSRKVGEATYTSSDQRDQRTQSRAVEELMIPPHLVSRLDPQTYALKVDADVYLMQAPFQPDPAIEIKMESENRRRHAREVKAFIDNQESCTDGRIKYTL